MNFSSLEHISDDEVFFGEISLKEAKKRIFINSYCDRQSLPESIETKKEYEHDNSIQIIETNSEPNMSCVRPSLSSPNSVANVTKSDWDIKSTDDSFLRLEKMVSDMCVSPKSVNDLDNTLDVVEYILNNPVAKENDSHNNAEYFLKNSLVCNESIIKDEETKNVLSSHENLNLHKTKMEVTNDGSNKFLQESPSNIQVDHNLSSHIKSENLVLPTPTKETTHVFKTPKNLLSTKKHTLTSSSKKTPNKVNAYQHITSPVAFYIRNCPQVPLIKDIHLKKPLTNATSIPKMATTPKENKINNKENILLPSVAYKSAKQTKMISVPDAQKLPSGQWVKKMSTSLPKPVVIKHSHREVKPLSKYSTSKSEDSFVGLPLKQADLSVCTKKTAFTKIT